ncbi:hypothetical protein ACRRTK_005510 [Alexandromys fortis]
MITCDDIHLGLIHSHQHPPLLRAPVGQPPRALVVGKEVLPLKWSPNPAFKMTQGASKKSCVPFGAQLSLPASQS